MYLCEGVAMLRKIYSFKVVSDCYSLLEFESERTHSIFFRLHVLGYF